MCRRCGAQPDRFEIDQLAEDGVADLDRRHHRGQHHAAHVSGGHPDFDLSHADGPLLQLEHGGELLNASLPEVLAAELDLDVAVLRLFEREAGPVGTLQLPGQDGHVGEEIAPRVGGRRPE